jgi:pantoate--beta-alanine ligase
MIIFSSIEQLKNHLYSIREEGKIIGFVPTMGALHKGHISLISKAKQDCDIVVCSIFVNPTQFNDLKDLEKYPRTLNADYQLLERVETDVVFVPEISGMYSEEELELKRQNIEDKSWTEGKKVNFGKLAEVMEGVQRPGHFNGVAQVVSKLFRIVEPHRAYFGQKDFQQLAIIRSMVKQLKMPIEIIGCPILREQNGLAMSSRNERLTKEERAIAGIISETLFRLKALQHSKTPAELKAFAEEELKKAPQIRLEYIEIADAETLQPVKKIEQKRPAVVCIAVKLGEVRLIDNVLL